MVWSKDRCPTRERNAAPQCPSHIWLEKDSTCCEVLRIAGPTRLEGKNIHILWTYCCYMGKWEYSYSDRVFHSGWNNVDRDKLWATDTKYNSMLYCSYMSSVWLRRTFSTLKSMLYFRHQTFCFTLDESLSDILLFYMAIICLINCESWQLLNNCFPEKNCNSPGILLSESVSSLNTLVISMTQ